MTPDQFAYWLQGFAELTRGQAPTAGQWQSIVEHLSLVFGKVTPPVVPDDLLERLKEGAKRAEPVPVPEIKPVETVEDAIRRMQDVWTERERGDSMRYPGGRAYTTGLGSKVDGLVITC